MDIMDLASKGIAAIAKSFGKKVAKQGPAPAIEQLKPTVISGAGFRAGFAREEIMPDLSDKNKIYWIAGHGIGHKIERVHDPITVSAMWIGADNNGGYVHLAADIIGLTNFEVNIVRDSLKEFCEKEIVQPTFVYGHPTSISPLAKMNEEDPRFADITDISQLPEHYLKEIEHFLGKPKYSYLKKATKGNYY